MAEDVTPLVEAYLIIEQPRQRLGHWTSVLAALDAPTAPPLAAVVAHYDPEADQALVNLRYDELALGPQQLAFVVEIALLAEIGMIQPAALSDMERRRFLGDRLARCTLRVTGQRGVVASLGELVKRVRAARNLGTSAAIVPAPSDGVPVPVPVVAAKGTRDDLEKVRGESPVDEQRNPRPAGAPNRYVVTRASRAKTVAGSPLGYDFDSDVDVEIVDEPEPLPPRPRAASPRFPAGEGGTIYARYLRSGKWVPIRVGSLSLKGAALMTGALPRLHDRVDVALQFATHRALVRGAVGKISTMRETASTGASTFSVAFDHDDASREQLVELLTAARAAKVTIKPPPARATRRFVVEWPVIIGTPCGAIKAAALDVSATGLFVRPHVALEAGALVNFSVVLDDTGPPIAGRACVVRKINEQDAEAAGLAAGYGCSIREMTAYDRERWLEFIVRIERRAEKRVLVGASPERFTELQTALAGAGYAVTGGADPGALAQLANADTRPVDAALLDGDWLGAGATAKWVANLFTSRKVPCVTVDGDVRRARTAIDQLLRVA